MATENKSEILPWEPSPLEKQRQWLQNKMLGIGSFATEHDIPFLTAFDDPYYTRNVAENMTLASEFLPGFGDVQGVREGKHMMGEGQPYMGATVMGLSALPFVPAKKLIDKLKVTPTKVERTNTDWETYGKQNDAGLFKNFKDDTGKFTSLMPLKVGRTNFETNAEKQLLKNTDYSNPNKKYSVDDVINSTVSRSPKNIQTTVREQFDEWVSPELRGDKATLQEMLDNIGKNKPTIKENYMKVEGTKDVGSYQYSKYMPNIPAVDNPSNAIEAAERTFPVKYTERSFSVNPPSGETLFRAPGHSDVGAEMFTASQSKNSDEFLNIPNRVFTSRSAMYEIDGQKVFIPAEGQSGAYRMADKPPNLNAPEGYREADIKYFLDFGENVSAESLGNDPAFTNALRKAGNTAEDWNAVVKEETDSLTAKMEAWKKEFNLPEDLDYKPLTSGLFPVATPVYRQTQAEIMQYKGGREAFEKARLLVQENKIEFSRKLSKLLEGDEPTKTPLFKEWFPMHMKTSLNDAVEQGADVVRFPVNDYSIAKQTGQNLTPATTRRYADEYTIDPEEGTDLLGQSVNYIPNKQSKALAKQYKKRTNEGIKRIESEYDIKLDPKFIQDENMNEFLEIRLTPELKEAFSKIIYNRGGAVYKKPLMALKY